MTRLTRAFVAVAMLLCLYSTKSTAQGLNFGAYSYITLTDILTDNQSYTKEAWIRIYEYQSTQGNNILSAWDHPFWLQNGVLSAANGYGNTGVTTVMDNANFPIGSWVHVAVTYDASSTTMKLYKNGVLVATNTASPAYVATDLQIGAQEYGDFFDGGDMDEVRLWNVARTQAQILANMNCDVPQQSGLVAYYRFNQGTAGADNTGLPSAYDYSGNANCGTLQNFNLTGSSSNYIAGAISSCNTITPALSAPASITGASSVCTGATTTLSNATTGGLWLVDDIDTAAVSSGGVVTGLYGGVVNISYKTCGGIATKTVTINPSPTVAGTAANGSIATAVAGGTSPYTYLWSNSLITANVSGLATGTYTVTVTDANGCKAVSSDYVTSAVILTNAITVTQSSNVYTGGNSNYIYLGYGSQTAVLTANPTGASSFTYSWSPTTHLSSGTSKNPTFTPTAAGTYTYTCTATNSGHSVSATVTMYVEDAVDHSHSGKIYVCHVSTCSGGHNNTKSLTSCNVSKQLSNCHSDHLCNSSGARQSAGPADTKGVLVIYDDITISAYPNPYSDAINVKVSSQSGYADITIYDITGKVMDTRLHQDTNGQVVVGQNLASGTYMLEARDGSQSKTVKVSKTN